MLLAKQHFMSGRSSSANGGWLAYLEQLVTGGLPALQRVDAFTFWEKDPVRVAVKEITEMHMGITKKQMEALARKHGVRGARLCGNQPVCRVRHRHAIEQASRRWRGGRRDESARTRRKILISTQAPATWSTGGASCPSPMSCAAS